MQEEDFYVAGLQFIEANGPDLATSSLGYDDWYTQNQLDGLTAVTTIAVNVATSNGLICITADGRVKPELLARGREVYTICARQGTECTTDTGGTSVVTSLMASMVAGVIQVQPSWTPATMRARLFETASYFLAHGTFDPLYVRGYGIPDATLAALSSTGVSNNPLMIGSNLLEQNAPNPFRPTTTIAYAVPLNGSVQLSVFDITGRLVRKLVGEVQAAGRYQVSWDGRDMAGRRAPSGIYFYRLVAGDVTETRRMVRMR